MLKTKYLWALAFAALCLGLMPGTASALAGDSWAVSDADLPDEMGWGRTYDASVDADNDGANEWLTGYELWSCEGSTSAGITLIDRWGLDLVPIASTTVAIGATETLDFTVTAPPMTGTFECDWVMTDGTTPFGPPLVLAEADVSVTQFPDVPIGYWSDDETEGCAGRVPFIVQGYPDGYYRPTVLVRRDQMAVFVRRGMDIAQTDPAEATFPDVPTDFWAFNDIETLVEAEVVEGYPSGYYRPEYVVSRDQMAVYIARAKGYADTPPAEATFPDVATDHWAFGEIELCYDNGIVQGYPDGLYRPNADIDRAQMSVYSYRAFVQATVGDGTPIVNGGPGTTGINPATALFTGWSMDQFDPTHAYVSFDVAALDGNLADDNTGWWDITFDFRDASTPTVTGTTQTESFNAATIDGASGTYFLVSIAIPAGVTGTPGDYVLAVIVEDREGDLIELNRTVWFRVS
jgi:hypothetical protein